MGSGRSQGADERRLLRRGHRVGGLGVGEFGDKDDLAGDGARARHRVTGGGAGDLPHPVSIAVMARVAVDFVAREVLQMPGNVNLLLGAERAGEDADEREPADILVVGRADDLGHQRARRIAGDGREVLAVGGGHGRHPRPVGAGKPFSNRASSSATPTPFAQCVGTMGKNRRPRWPPADHRAGWSRRVPRRRDSDRASTRPRTPR